MSLVCSVYYTNETSDGYKSKMRICNATCPDDEWYYMQISKSEDDEDPATAMY